MSMLLFISVLLFLIFLKGSQNPSNPAISMPTAALNFCSMWLKLKNKIKKELGEESPLKSVLGDGHFHVCFWGPLVFYKNVLLAKLARYNLHSTCISFTVDII